MLAVWDILRFGFLALFLLPTLVGSFSVTEGSSSNYRLLLWLSAPQLIIPAYMGAISCGLITDRHIKPVGIGAKCLGLVPGMLVLIFLIASLLGTGPNGDEILLLLRLGIVLLFDLLFCVILLVYKQKED